MKTVRLHGDGKVAIAEAPRPEPGPGQVLIRTAVSALCGSELSAYRGSGAAQGNPGHEAAGVVEAPGDGAAGLRPGQRVGVSAISGCGRCRFCRQGQYTWCPARSFFGSMHAEMFVVPAHACHPLPDDLSWEAGVLLTGDGFGVPFHTSTKLRDRPVESVAVFGMGPIGLGNLLMQRHLGRRVIAVDVSERRLEYARQLGADHLIGPDRSGEADGIVRELTGGEGADVCIEAAGRPETARLCFRAVRTAGIVVFNGEQSAVELSPSEDFIRRDVWAVGSWYYHFGEFPQMLALYRSGLAVDRLVTHRFPLEQAAEGYQAMALRQTGKVVLTSGQSG
jgi:threonine dehydrogenase-like Zn-dependent dehydrogenase